MGIFSSIGKALGSVAKGVTGFLGDNVGSIISAGSSLLGGQNANDNASAIRAADLQAQREFAQHGIRWKVADAKAAGLHPLAAIGGIGASYTPSATTVGDSGYASAGEHLGNALNNMGQNTKRAQVATMTAEERAMSDATIENMKLRNRLLEAQITSEWSNVMGQPRTPTMPSAVNPGASKVSKHINAARPGLIDGQPSVSISASPGDLGMEAGRTPSFKPYDLSPRISIPMPSSAASEAFEQMGPGAAPAALAVRGVDKFFRGGTPPSANLLPRDHRWEWSVLRQSYIPVKITTPKKRSAFPTRIPKRKD